MNTLQSLLHDSLVGSGHVECCALVRRKDGAVKASSIGYEPSAEQVLALNEAFKNPSPCREHGIHFNGATYQCVRADKNSIYAKKEGSGFVAVRTGSMIVFGSYSSAMHPSVCVEAVEKLGEYFREKGK